jgi:O-antigen/teichoic acid export membrane protein
VAQQSLFQVMLRSMAWSAFGAIFRALAQLAVLMVLSRTLTHAEYGVATLLISFFNLVWVMFEVGIGMAVLQRPFLDEARIRTSFTMALFAGLVVPTSIALFAEKLAAFFSMPALAAPLYLLCVGMSLRSLTIVSEYLLTRDLAFRRLAIVEILSFGTGFAGVSIIGGLSGAGIWALAAGQVAYCGLKSLLLIVCRRHPARPLLSLPLLREMGYYATGFGCGSSMATASHEIDKILLGRLMDSTMLGIYGRSIQLFLMPTVLLGQVVDRVLFSVLASVNSDPARVQKAMRGGTAFFSLIILPGSVVIAALAPELVRVLLGPGWTQVVEPLQVLCMGMYMRTAVKVSEGIVRAQGAVFHRLYYYGVSTAFVAAGTAIGYRWGLIGVTIGNVFATAVFFILMTRLSLRYAQVRVSEYLYAHIPSVLLGLFVATEALLLLPWLRHAFDNNDWAVLSFGGTAAATSAIVACIAMPKLFVGPDSLWLMKKLLGSLRLKLA